MDELWRAAIKWCGGAAVAGFVGVTVYPQIIASPYLKNLTHTELFTLLVLIVVVVFGLCLAVVNARAKRSPESNTINIKGSTVHGSVHAGNKTFRKNK